jgi:hypothetical protein
MLPLAPAPWSALSTQPENVLLKSDPTRRLGVTAKVGCRQRLAACTRAMRPSPLATLL